MPSQIDPLKPVGNTREAIEIRQNFAAAATEISTLQEGGDQDAVADLQQQVALLQTQVADLTSRVTTLEQARDEPPAC